MRAFLLAQQQSTQPGRGGKGSATFAQLCPCKQERTTGRHTGTDATLREQSHNLGRAQRAMETPVPVEGEQDRLGESLTAERDRIPRQAPLS